MFLVNITAAVGAFGFGYLQDRIGHKRALGITLIVWVLMIVLAAMAVNRPVFWTAANLAGLAMGSSQSAGRAIVAILSPKTRSAEFFSFWNMALWLAAIVGPLAYGSVTWITNNDHRLAICVTGLFFAAAVLALIPVNLSAAGELLRKQMPLHAARRRTINVIGLHICRKAGRTFDSGRSRPNGNDRGRRDPSAECKESAFFLPFCDQ